METPEQCVKYFTKLGKPGLVPSDTEIEDSKYINWSHSSKLKIPNTSIEVTLQSLFWSTTKKVQIVIHIFLQYLEYFINAYFQTLGAYVFQTLQRGTKNLVLNISVRSGTKWFCINIRTRKTSILENHFCIL